MNILSNSFCHFHIINILNYKEKKRNVQIQKELKWKSKTFVNNLNISLGRKRFYFRKKSVFDLDTDMYVDGFDCIYMYWYIYYVTRQSTVMSGVQ